PSVGQSTFGREDVVFCFTEVVAGFVERLGIALALAGRGFGFGSLKTGAGFVVVETDQQLTLFDLVVEFDGHFGDAAKKLGANADQARLRLDAARGGSEPVDFRRGCFSLEGVFLLGFRSESAEEIAARNGDGSERACRDRDAKEEEFRDKSSSRPA